MIYPVGFMRVIAPAIFADIRFFMEGAASVPSILSLLGVND
jgi:hypothetical protein